MLLISSLRSSEDANVGTASPAGAGAVAALMLPRCSLVTEMTQVVGRVRQRAVEATDDPHETYGFTLRKQAVLGPELKPLQQLQRNGS